MTLEEICSEVTRFIGTPSRTPQAFDALARKVFGFQYAHNAAYRAFCESSAVTPENLRLISEIPSVVTTAFKELELTVLPKDQRPAVFHSSGTTEHRPSRHFHSRDTLRVYEESLLRWFTPHIHPKGEPLNFLVLTPRAVNAPHSSLVHMFETIAERFGDSAEFVASQTANGWDLNFEKFRQAHARFCAMGIPVVVCGTAFSFVQLCDELETKPLAAKLPSGSRVFETGGYKGRSREVSKAELHNMISEQLGVPEIHIVSEYGMSELSSQAYDRVVGSAGDRIFRFPPWARACVISPESGREVAEDETGLLRIIDLANVGSVMSIQTEDLAVRRGDGFELVGRASAAEARGCSLMQVA
ncbi:MAG TPA: hypothetical protein VF773_08230 [Verrucomicrobiae bacterium]